MVVRTHKVKVGQSRLPEIKARIRSLRRGQEITLEELGKRAGLNTTSAWEIEKNPKRDIRYSELERIATALGTTVEDLEKDGKHATPAQRKGRRAAD